jgi:hypothetical protein
MPRITKKLPSIANVTAGATATLSCPVGKTYNKIMLVYTGTDVARTDFKNINVNINGKSVQTYADGAELDLINDYYGRSDTAGVLTLHFNRPEAHNLLNQRLTGLGTLDVQTLDIAFDIDATAPGDLAMEAYAVLSEGMPLGAFVKFKRFPVTYATSGEQEIDNIPKGPNIMAIHLKKADVSNVEVEVDGFKFFEGSKTIIEALQKEAEPKARVPQGASCTHVDFMLEGDYQQSLATRYPKKNPDGSDHPLAGRNVQDLRIRPTIDTAGALVALVEYLDGFAGI